MNESEAFENTYIEEHWFILFATYHLHLVPGKNGILRYIWYGMVWYGMVR